MDIHIQHKDNDLKVKIDIDNIPNSTIAAHTIILLDMIKDAVKQKYENLQPGGKGFCVVIHKDKQ